MMPWLGIGAAWLSLLLAACGSAPIPRTPEVLRAQPPQPAPTPAPKPAVVAPVPADAPAPRTVTRSGPQWRCGWFENPTPGNAWLIDRDGQWLVGAQGGPQAEGEWPEFGADQWVRSNRRYGHGCVCLMLRVDLAEQRVLQILAAQPRPLSVCRGDQTLPPEPRSGGG